MRRWGIVITAFYAFSLAVLFVPAFLGIAFGWASPASTLRDSLNAAGDWRVWLWIGLLVSGEALLLFLSVDGSWRHAKPRQHVAVTAILTGFFTALLALSAISSLASGLFGDEALKWMLDGKDEAVVWGRLLCVLLALWGAWAAVFLFYCGDAPKPVAVTVSWLLKGSVLELLIAVPSHVIVRQRGDCSAPAVTGWGIVTGIAVMLFCFGPGVLALYKKKLDGYARKREQNLEGRT